MLALARPRVVVSKCLGFDACRWNGDIINDDFVTRLGQFVDYFPVCPEIEIGLGVPRKPIRLVASGETVHVFQPDTEQDHTAKMRQFCKHHLDSLTNIDGFVLKNRSPSCGPFDVKVYHSLERGAASRKGRGFFGGMAQDTFTHAAIEHDGRIKNFSLREHFLIKLFTLAALRNVAASGSMAKLVSFHSANKLLLMAYNQQQMRVMGRIVANTRHHDFGFLIDQYRQSLLQAMKRSARYTSHINTMEHIMGYFKKSLKVSEKQFFAEMVQQYRQGRTPLSALLAVLHSWVVRYDNAYLAAQTYFAPYPLELVDISDSGKGRDL